ncbi:hypothetical protein DNTS_030109 [Danionella cerebrum]|uniref:Uncharacterized protein n=1 Tax=Danionella cerebrum TaxID=2873325 RepID=A0A553Q1S5_9TELE|nr:hypothetical protein DNTS_030109 [Danionella translucida]
MYAKGKSNNVPSDSQAREKLALYVYEYLLHVGAQKSAQSFLSEVSLFKLLVIDVPSRSRASWDKMGEEHHIGGASRILTLMVVSAAAAPSPVLGGMPSGEGMPVGSVPPGFFQSIMSSRYPGSPRAPLRTPNQALAGVPGNQLLLDPSRQQVTPALEGDEMVRYVACVTSLSPSDVLTHFFLRSDWTANMGGTLQRMTPVRGMVPPSPQGYGGGMRPPLSALMGPGMNMAPGGRPWPNSQNPSSIPYSSASPGSYVGPLGAGGAPGTPILHSPGDSTNSGENMYTLISALPPGGTRQNFPLGPGSDGLMGGIAGLEPHHMNGSLVDMDSMPKSSPGSLSITNPPGTPRDEAEMTGSFLNPFQNEAYSPNMTMSV